MENLKSKEFKALFIREDEHEIMMTSPKFAGSLRRWVSDVSAHKLVLTPWVLFRTLFFTCDACVGRSDGDSTGPCRILGEKEKADCRVSATPTC